MAVSEMLMSLATNPYFSAGAGLFGVGTLAAVGRTLGTISVSAFKKHYVTSLEVPCNDKSYHWVLDWVSREAGRTSQHVSVRTEWEEEEGGRVSATYRIEPSPGTHLIRWRGAWIRLDRVREQQQVDVIGGVPWETVTLTKLGRRRGLTFTQQKNSKISPAQIQAHLLLYKDDICSAIENWQHIQ